MPQRSTRAIEWLRLGRRYVDNRIDQFEKLTIRRLFVKIVSLVANRVTLAAFHSMIVVIKHFLERSAINHGLIALETFALFPFEHLDRYGTKLDPLHRPPRIRIALENLDSVKPSVVKSGEETFFSKRTGNAAAPKLRILLHFFRNFLVAHNVGNHGPPTFFQNAKYFVEEMPFGFRLNQVKHATRNDHVHRIACNQRMLHAQFLPQLIRREK